MKKTLFSTLTVFTLLASTFHSTAAQAIEFSEALALAYQNNPDLNSARKNLHAVDELAPQALSGWLPSASITLERGREQAQYGQRPKINENVTNRNYQITQPLFNGGQTVAQMRRAKNLIKAERANVARAEQTVLLQAITAYMDVVRAEQVLKLAENNIDVLHKHKTSTDERFRLGEVTRTDVAQSSARISRGETDRIRAQGDLDSARASFKRIVGVDVDQLSMPAIVKELPATLDEAIQVAINNNPNFHNAQFNSRAARDDVRTSQAVLLPRAALQADIRSSDGYASTSGLSYADRTATVNVSIPLYQSGAEYSRIRQYKETAQKRKFDAEQVKNTVVESTVRAWRNLDQAMATIKSATAASDAANVALTGVSREADVGSRTTLDVLDAQQELFTAQSDIVRAKRDEIVNYYTLKSAMGQLTAKDLNLKVERFDPTAHYNKVRYKIIGF